MSMMVTRLRCEYLGNPLGIDERKPRLSWALTSDERGQRQTAYRVLVASTPEILAAGRGDLWDSGKVDSDQTTHVEYAGGKLATRMLCYWKVRAWDAGGGPSPWSEPAFWSMGLLEASDWQAQWIAFADSTPPPPDRHFGYLSRMARSADAGKWLEIDLGEDRRIDSVRLHPARPIASKSGYVPMGGWHPNGPGFMFPVRFKIEAALKGDFSDTVALVDKTDADVPNPSLEVLTCDFPPILARYIRLNVTRMLERNGRNFAFALAELEVFSGSRNVAIGGCVSASDSVETGGWSKDYLVDGRLGDREGAEEAFEWPATMLRKEFDISGPIRRAVVSVTGLGMYELRVNGRRVGDQLLAPEWTRYQDRIQYQTHDVTDLLQPGSNAVGAQLNAGWWTGPLGIESIVRNPQFCLLLRLDVELADSSLRTVVSDSSWLATTEGPIRRAGIYFGETYDGTMEVPGWDQPGFEGEGWSPVRVLPCPEKSKNAAYVAQCNEPIRVVRELRPIEMTEPRPGVYVFDLGQNMAGWCRLKTDAPAGTKITVRHAEVLDEEGMLYTDNLRGAAQINEYTWPGGFRELEPHFTYHGFRYVEVTGLSNRPDKDAILGRVFHSSAPDVGTFSCSNDLINRIMHCVEWVHRGNIHSAPTDCPQRTERMGFTGDILAFCQTAIFKMDMAGFFTKWIPDLRDAQLETGQFPILAPQRADLDFLRWANGEFAPAWSDAGVIIPWRVYCNYGDKRMLRQQYEAAKRWVEFIHTRNPDNIWRNDRGGDCGDHCNCAHVELADYPREGNAISREAFATAFYAHSTVTLARIASVLGLSEDEDAYGKLFHAIKKAFNEEYVEADGRIMGDTQAGYALALHFDLLDEPLRSRAVEYLIEAIRRYKGHLSTGIHTSHLAMLELSGNGHHDEAGRLINLRTVPSWGHMVEQGATTIWEKWDGIVPGRGFSHPVMNSFNHWAFGSVGEWVWRELAGINPDEAQPGYKHFYLRPRPCAGLAWVKARYESIRGPIVSEWELSSGRFSLHVEIPANTSATVYVPVERKEAVTESGRPATKAEGVRSLRIQDREAVFEVESGSYNFTAAQ